MNPVSAKLTRSFVHVGAVCAVFFCLSESRAQAKGFNLTLQYTVTPGCPSAAEFKAIVAGRLGYDPFVEGTPDRVLVWVGPHGGVLDGRLEWRDATGGWVGEQTFPSATTDCARFARVLGFALAVQIQLLANARGVASSAAPPVEVPAPVAEPVIAPPDTAQVPVPKISVETRPAPVVVETAPPSVAPAPSPSFALGVGSSVALGMASSPILLGHILGMLSWTGASLELGAELSVPSITRREDGAAFSQQHLLASAAACAVFAPWSACGVVKGGQVRMSGRDIDRPTSATVPLLEAGLRVGAGQRLGGRVVLNAHVDGLIAVNRWTATLDKVPVWTAPHFAAAAGVDVVVRFP